MRLIAISAAAVLLFSSVAAFAADTAPTAAQSSAFLAAYATKAGVVVTPGIQYRVLKPGTGEMPTHRDCATVNYKGSFTNGVVFDESKPGQPVTFPVAAVIAGWTEALQMMHAGEKWELVIPPGLAYGKLGTPGGPIPPNQTLVFEVELLKVKPLENGHC